MDWGVTMSRDDLGTLLNTILDNQRETRDDIREINRKQDLQTQEIGKVLTQAEKTNGRVNGHDKQIAALETIRGRKISLPNNVLYLLAIGGVIALAIVASLLKVDLGGIL